MLRNPLLLLMWTADQIPVQPWPKLFLVANQSPGLVRLLKMTDRFRLFKDVIMSMGYGSEWTSVYMETGVPLSAKQLVFHGASPAFDTGTYVIF